MSAAEEQRAADYRAEQLARARAELARRVGLRGSPSARAALAAAWQPIALAGGELVTVARGMLAGKQDLDGAYADEEPIYESDQIA